MKIKNNSNQNFINNKIKYSFIFWLISLILIISFFIVKNNSKKISINEILFILQLITLSVFSFLFFLNNIEKKLNEKFNSRKTKILISFSFIFFFILFFSLLNLFSFFTNNNNQKNINNNKEIAKNTLISTGLKLGSTGEQVKILQAALSTDKSIYPSGVVSGYYGELTKQAVINFQEKYNLPTTGEIDQQTAEKFNEVYGDKTKEDYLSLISTPLTNFNSNSIKNNQTDNDIKWGEVKQIDETTYASKFNMDSKMATPQEIFQAVNNFRRNYGKGELQWDDGLAKWAESRAQTFVNLGDTDDHFGFKSEVEEKAQELRFGLAGENALYGGRLEAVHLIEWTFAQDEPHKQNLLNDRYTHIGIGTRTNDNVFYGVDLIFAGKRY